MVLDLVFWDTSFLALVSLRTFQAWCMFEFGPGEVTQT